tara:strand:+ start:7138 stop:7548 length:411 start_codon:yes stop_codon:yes gene_type:complete
MKLHTINIPPHACPRPRLNRRTGGVYYPRNYNLWRTRAKAAVKQLNLEPITDPKMPLFVRVDFTLKGIIASLHIKKPDLDNLLKAFVDVLVDCGLIPDDRQICRITTTKDTCGAGYEESISFGYGPILAVHYPKEQ